MPKRLETSFVKVSYVEESGEDLFKVGLDSKDFGMCEFKVNVKYSDLFKFGKKYIGVYEISGSPDFLEEEDDWMNVCTMTTQLRRIFDKEKFIYEFDSK